MAPRYLLILMVNTVLLAFGAGCTTGGHFTLLGYSTEPPYDASIQTVFVPIAKNVSYARGIEFDLTRLVIREIESKTPYRVVDRRECADTVLDLKIINRRKMLLLANPANLPRDVEVGVLVEVVWRDQRPGRNGDILSSPRDAKVEELPLPGEEPATRGAVIPVTVIPTATYVPELGGSTTSAQFQAVQRAATQIVSMMESYQGWK